uniref:Uncharacterized protein n=1 Tax=Rhizophora mucronata TaxID=61149 RepID=A0A2P2Q677_RHIMU
MWEMSLCRLITKFFHLLVSGYQGAPVSPIAMLTPCAFTKFSASLWCPPVFLCEFSCLFCFWNFGLVCWILCCFLPCHLGACGHPHACLMNCLRSINKSFFMTNNR